MLKEPTTYEIMRPEDVGFAATDLVLGKHSGRAALADKAKQLGFNLTGDQLQSVFEEFKKLADRKKDVFDGDIRALIQHKVVGKIKEEWTLVTYNVDLPYKKTPTINLTLKQHDVEKSITVTDGSGVVDAAFLAVNQLTGIELKCKDYQVRSSSLGRDAQGQVTIQVEYGGELHRGQAVSVDCVEASIKAILNAVNRILESQQQPQGETVDVKSSV
jgi:2-isopropylmalate synthase